MMLDDNFALSGPDQVLSCMQMMFPLAETVYEVTTENMKRQTDMRLLQKQHSIKQVKRVDGEFMQVGHEER